MNVPVELSGRQERQLRDCYATLHELASCGVPSVRAAARAALAELHAALDGQALEFEFYSHRWAPDQAPRRRPGTSPVVPEKFPDPCCEPQLPVGGVRP